MVIAFSVFAFGIRKYKIADYHPFEYHPVKLLKAVLLIGILWAISFYILYYPDFADLAFGLVILLSIAYLVDSVRRESAKQAHQSIVIGILCVISVVVWAFYFQMFMSLTLFLSRVVEPTLFGILFPPPFLCYDPKHWNVDCRLFYFTCKPQGQCNAKRNQNRKQVSACHGLYGYGLRAYCL